MHNSQAGVQASGAKPTDQDIQDRIFEAILARRLRPGAPLREEELAQLFGVSRTKVRPAIAKLAQAGLVQVRRNHGATVAAPTRQEARHVMELRAMIEPPVAAALARACPHAAIQALRGHVVREHAARTKADHAGLVRLTGEFHLRLADLHGNLLLARSLRDMEALTCLSILSYGRPNAAACLPDEHERILAAIEQGDADAASCLMRHHLEHVAAEMDLAEPGAPTLAQALDVRSAA